MRIEALALEGAFLLIPEPARDARGFFARCFSAAALERAGMMSAYPEWSLSYNAARGTLRGMHWQAAPHQEAKLVQCIRGAIFDVIVDLRRGSASYGRWHGVTLSAENRHMLYVPPGFAHGFQTLADASELYYHISQAYRPEGARGVRWDDPDLAIEWPDVPVRTMSERDAGLPLLRDIDPDG